MEDILKIRGLNKMYSGQLALNDVNMTVHEGDIYGFIGENGAGKTTVIRTITGLISADSGDYELFGVSSKDKAIYEARKKVQAVVESPSIYLNMSARDNLILQMKLLGINDYSKIDDILDLVGLSQIKNSKKSAKNFSLGMRQRLGIAISLVGDPKLIILDEPTNGLDPEGIIAMRELLLKINKEKNITMIISSHILGELEKLASTFGFIHKGHIVNEISKEELLHTFEKKTILELSDANGVEEALKDTVKFKLDGNKLTIIGDFVTSDVVMALSKKGIMVNNMKSIDSSVESYYMSLMGGKKNA